MTKPESSVDAALRLARELRPDLWQRTEQVARIIDPAAFAEGWVLDDRETRELYDARQRYMRSSAMVKAQDVLCYLGVNVDTDWYEILNRIAGESSREEVA